MKNCCVVVIGHVDHGKTTLVRALTGIETDRLPEEKARGLSIVPGFGHVTYPGGVVDFVDAPGHEDFVQAMVAGASGARAAMLVVSAVEGVAAQTLEHLAIARILGIRTGVIAVTKSDLLNAKDHDACLGEMRDALSGTVLEDAPMILCSAVSGNGLDWLHSEMQAIMSAPNTMPAPLHSFLPVDRAFSVTGQGTVVTGTLHGTGISVGDTLNLSGTGQKAVIRGLQSRSVVRSGVVAGERVAVNLRNVAVADIPRGTVLTAKGASAASNCMDALVKVEAEAGRSLKHLEDVRVLFGTSSEVAQIRLFANRQIEPGTSGFAQFRFAKPVMAFAGQPAVIRRLSPVQTIAGAVFLDPDATPTRGGDKHRLRVLQAAVAGDANLIAHSLCAAQGGTAPLADIARLARLPVVQLQAALAAGYVTVTDGVIATAADIDACKADILSGLARYHTAHPLQRFASLARFRRQKQSTLLFDCALACLLQEGSVLANGTGLALKQHDPVANLSETQRLRVSEIEHSFLTAALAPPARETVLTSSMDHELVDLLIDGGRLVALENIALGQTIVSHVDALTTAAKMLLTAFPPPLDFTTSQARAALNTSRRIIVPVLEYFDAQGMTTRTGDTRSIKLSE